MDSNNFSEVIEFAIQREIEAQEFYAKAQELAFNDASKQMFDEFRLEEVKHQKILEKVQKEGVEDYTIKPIPNLKIAEFLIDIPFKPTCRCPTLSISLSSGRRSPTTSIPTWRRMRRTAL